MKNTLLILLGLLIAGCSTTNRQVIIECNQKSCVRSKPSVATSMSPTNMTARINSSASKVSTAKTNVVQTNTIATNSVSTNSVSKTNSVATTNQAPAITNIPTTTLTNKTVWRDNALFEETTVAVVDHYYIIQ